MAYPASGSPTGPPRLVRRGQDGETLGHHLIKGSVVVGRHPQCDLVVPEDSVSRRHAQLEASGGYVVVSDLGSSNGTFVNGQRVQRRSLRNGDRLSFGSVDFVFQDDPRRDAAHSWASAVDVLDELVTEHAFIPGDAPSDHTAILREMAREMSDEVAVRRATERLATLYRLGEILRQADDEENDLLFGRVLDLLFESMSAERGAILLRRPTDSDFEPVAARTRARGAQSRVALSRSILERVVGSRVAVLSSDTQADDRFNTADSVVLHSIRSAICAPLLGRGEVVGVIHLDATSKSRVFTSEDLQFLTTFATEVAVTVENRAMRREAVHRERLAAVGEAVAGISHNAKNSLVMIGSGADVLALSIKKRDWQGVEDSWGAVQRGLARLEKLTAEMLEFSSHREPRLEEEDVNALLAQLAEEVRPRFAELGASLRLELEEGLKPRLIDAEGLQRILMNLVLNALDVLPKEGGEVIITTTEHADRVLDIIVYDNGPGIPAGMADEIFKPFFTTKGSSGTGLGLPMCRKIAEDLGGRITVDDTPGKGAAFTVSLPFLKPSLGAETQVTKF